MNFKHIKKIIILSLSILIISVILFNVTYSYLNTNYNNNQKIVNLTTDTINLEIIFNKGINLNSGKILPGYSFSRSFTIINKSNKGTYYDINLIDVQNSFKNDELVYYLSNDKGISLLESVFPTENSTIASKLYIPSNSIQNYVLTVVFKNENANQNYNQKAKMNSKIEITSSY